MVYIYKKRIGKKDYYYLRASVKQKQKLITKDIAYLGDDPEKIYEKLEALPQKEIRKSYHKLKRFIESDYYLKKAEEQNHDIEFDGINEVEACRIHWRSKVLRLDEKTLHETLRNFVIELTYNTTSIEGNTITLKEAHRLLAENLTPKNRTLREIYDIKNTENVFFELWKEKEDLTHEFIIELHKSLLKNIDERTGYRTGDVRVFRSSFKSTPHQFIAADMDALLQWYKENQDIHPLILACVFHHKFEKIHPFFDGNGRTGRMLMNYILMQRRYPPIIHQKKHRTEYLDALQDADKCPLGKYDKKSYEKLVELSSFFMQDKYWDNFLI
ncbi:Fic family protein [Candidatus Woesearchaeota archaeon]|nr:Fic family protein [Candidatus Woesearchaeota archaeon]